MSVNVRVTELNLDDRTVIVEAYNDNKRIFRSPMKYTRLTKDAIEKQLKKELKAFNSPVWGGLLCNLCLSDRGVMI